MGLIGETCNFIQVSPIKKTDCSHLFVTTEYWNRFFLSKYSHLITDTSELFFPDVALKQCQSVGWSIGQLLKIWFRHSCPSLVRVVINHPPMFPLAQSSRQISENIVETTFDLKKKQPEILAWVEFSLCRTIGWLLWFRLYNKAAMCGLLWTWWEVGGHFGALTV